MKKLPSLVLAAVAAPAAFLALAPGAQAGSSGGVTLTVDRPSVYAGSRVTATAGAPNTCDWVLEWAGDRRVHTGQRFVVAYTAPAVTRPTRIPLTATCFEHPAAAPTRVPATPGTLANGTLANVATTQSLTVTVPRSWRRTVVITVRPRHSAVSPPTTGGSGPGGGAGALPATGGPALWIVLAGLVSVAAGHRLARGRSLAVAQISLGARRSGPSRPGPAAPLR